jgi:membrane associated rhomboid family serine protease
MARRKVLADALTISTLMVALLVVVEVIDHLHPFPLDAFGIVPRTARGFLGILFSPLLHGNFPHLFANAVPLWILLTLLYMDRAYHPTRTLALIWYASGLGTWLIGRTAIHIGASSIVFGLVAYLIVSGILMKSWRSFFIALGVFFLFGGIFYGALPQAGPISWEGHLCGALAGIWTARRNH